MSNRLLFDDSRISHRSLAGVALAVKHDIWSPSFHSSTRIFFLWNISLFLTPSLKNENSTKMTSADQEIDRFFAKSHYCTGPVLARVRSDIVDLMHTLRLSIRSSQWGDTSQVKLCVYGGIPIGSKSDYLIPIQIWLTSAYPIDPPTIYVAPSDNQKVLSNSKIVDGTGLCYCPNLAQWKPVSSSLRSVVIQLAKLFQSSPPLWTDVAAEEGGGSHHTSKPSSNGGAAGQSNEGGEGENECVICWCNPKDTVLVPCGHFCVCSSCAANVPSCPVCRAVIQFRQKVYL